MHTYRHASEEGGEEHLTKNFNLLKISSCFQLIHNLGSQGCRLSPASRVRIGRRYDSRPVYRQGV